MEPYNQHAIPPFGSNTDPIKNAHDTYDIYINDEFIGRKTLLTQSENINDVIEFLEMQGIKDVAAQLNGDHYVIKSDEPDHIKKIIRTYLQNR